MYTTSSVIALLAAAVAAQTTTGSASPATVTVTGGSQLIKVGLDTDGSAAFRFTPEIVYAQPGDQLMFSFYPMQHSVAQAAFDAPCMPSGDDAIFSGFFPSQQGPNGTIFTVTVNETTPLWFYCSASDHCQDGMVMAVNPPQSGNTLDAFRQAAADASDNESPATVQGGVFSQISDTPSTTSTPSDATTTEEPGMTDVPIQSSPTESTPTDEPTQTSDDMTMTDTATPSPTDDGNAAPISYTNSGLVAIIAALGAAAGLL